MSAEKEGVALFDRKILQTFSDKHAQMNLAQLDQAICIKKSK